MRMTSGLVMAGMMAVMASVGAVAQVGGVGHPTTDSSVIGPDGTAYVTRVVPVPETVSPEAQTMLSRVMPDTKKATTLE